jgi:hypothetical protein
MGRRSAAIAGLGLFVWLGAGAIATAQAPVKAPAETPVAAPAETVAAPAATPDAPGLDAALQALSDSLAASEPFHLTDPRARAIQQFRRVHPYVATALRVGEKLTFSVRYGPIRGGEATIEIPDRAFVDGDSCYHLLTTAQSNDVFSTFFFVRDRVESFASTDLLQPRRFEKHLREGDYQADVVVRLDPVNHIAIYDDSTIVETRPGTHDILTAFFSARARVLEPGMTFNLDCHADRKNYPLRTQVLRRERVEVPVGTFDCVVVEPMLRTPGLFKQEGTLTIWLTDDSRHIPVQMKSKLPIGSISVVLTDVAGRPDWKANR